MIDLLGQMIRLPLFLMTSGMDAFAVMMRQFQQSVDQGLDSLSPALRAGRNNSAGRPMPADDDRQRASDPVADPAAPAAVTTPTARGATRPRQAAPQEPNSTPHP